MVIDTEFNITANVFRPYAYRLIRTSTYLRVFTHWRLG